MRQHNRDSWHRLHAGLLLEGSTGRVKERRITLRLCEPAIANAYTVFTNELCQVSLHDRGGSHVAVRVLPKHLQRRTGEAHHRARPSQRMPPCKPGLKQFVNPQRTYS